MSFNVGSEVATANHFGGLVSAVQREELRAGVIDEDARRKFWVYHMLPKLSEAFLDKVVEEKFVLFSLEGLDEPNSPPSHVAALQSFAHLCAPLKSVSARHIPWQFRFVLSENTRTVLNSSHATDVALRNDVFEKAGWVFWIVDDGFCLAPKAMCDELSDINAVTSAWLKIRNEFELPAAAVLALKAQAETALPEPPALERLTIQSSK